MVNKLVHVITYTICEVFTVEEINNTEILIHIYLFV